MQKNLHMRLHSFRSLLSASLRLTLVVASAALLTQCMHPRAGAPAPAPVADSSRYMPSAEASPGSSNRSSPVKRRPGLGTELGYEIGDDTRSEAFFRKALNSPDAVGIFHYNDKEGAELMAKLEGSSVKQGSGSFDLIPGKLRVAMMDNSWSSGALEHYRTREGIYVIGSPGAQYTIKLENRTENRLEAVVSVDGLDLLDGQPASVKKRGYVIPAKSSIVIRGMRVNGKMFSLKFGTVAEARASKAFGEKGARNVGVIGVACYEEDGRARRRAQVQENYVRQGASAFSN